MQNTAFFRRKVPASRTGEIVDILSIAKTYYIHKFRNAFENDIKSNYHSIKQGNNRAVWERSFCKEP